MDSRMHRRKSSKEDALVEGSGGTSTANVAFPAHTEPNGVDRPAPEVLRERVNSVPSPSYHRSEGPSSAGPHRTSFAIPNHNQPPSPFRPAFSHSRSFSGTTFASSSKVPPPPKLNGSIPKRSLSGDGNPSYQMPNSSSNAPLKPYANGAPPSPTQTRRHGRIHSRNLSIYFPKPGSLPASSIAEDDSSAGEENSATIIPSESSMTVPTMQKPPGRKRFGDGFTFGGKSTSPSNSNSDDGDSSVSPVTPRMTRRIHRHKKSMSHNFFSFLEPGVDHQTSSSNLMATQWETSQPPTPIPSPYNTIQQTSPPLALVVDKQLSLTSATAMTVVQFLLGASLWVSGQQNGSLGCTGLGYWVVFDSFGMALTHLLPSHLASRSLASENRRSYGNDRIETLALFAQTIYLIFASVYVCKETVEHILLSLGDGHHHHRMDEGVEGIQFPVFLFLVTTVSLISTSMFYDNHANLLKTSGHKIPSNLLMAYVSRLRSSLAKSSHPSPLSIVVTNPYTLTPLLFTLAMLIASVLLPTSQHRPFDLFVAALETIITFSIAYPAAVIQGAVLLQTAPGRGLPGGRMEAFLRTMREIERHPLVLHLPAPHMWQLTPSPCANDFSDAAKNKLVVTIELHVRKDLDDNEVLSLTRWAHDRVRLALNLGSRSKEHDDDSEVTVGIVRG
ncbi:hypothetical protein SCHPADRAFT_882816 [Schizopora paradoxa]|uniref:Cation efflux protein n=1 Tax=Schizopora paradoxa TaxID=27342 RepID=A0A0H2RNY7_9AGAM|nr:hypothetical protein SCHPADRAFT_882816 [Schizopora paradoxa]